jgi:thymidylate synthase (FAD)
MKIVKLISYSQTHPNQMIISPTPDVDYSVQDLIAYCARVSNPSNQNNSVTADKLIRYLVKHKHWSPLEMVSACLEIETTRDIARQILRHRSFSFQEFSQRYADPTQDLDFVTREARLQDEKNRQNSVEVDDPKLQEEWDTLQEMVIEDARSAYNWAISKGIAKEQARAVLPEGLTMSRMYINGTLRSWVHYIELRSGHGTQKEHMDIAKECAVALAPIFPMIQEFVNE